MKKETIQPWPVSHSEPGPNLVLFQARYDHVTNPRNEQPLKAVILETRDWVNVVAVTPEGKILTVRQFRLGVRKVTVEVPAGVMEPGEDPLAAAKRELREETGYTCSEWKYIGYVDPNSAFMNNRCHFWLATNAMKTEQVELDESEEIEVAEYSLEEMINLVENGMVSNSLALLSLSRVFDLRSRAEKEQFPFQKA